MNRAKRSNKPGTLAKKDARSGFLFTLPWLIGTLTFFAYPFVMVFFYAFSNVEANNLKLTGFVGWDNYIDVFTTDSTFVRGFFESVGGIFSNAVFILFFSMFVALILKSKFRGRTLVRAIFFLPVIIASGPVIEIINGESLATMMMTGERTSTLFTTSSMESVLIGLGLPEQITTLFTTVISGIFNLSWQSGIQILLFLAGLQGIPGHLYEAADVEGASKWESFWRITFPMITPILLLNTVYTIIDGFTSFQNKIIKLIVDYTDNLHLSYGAALGTSYFLAVFVIIVVLYLIINRKTFYMER